LNEEDALAARIARAIERFENPVDLLPPKSVNLKDNSAANAAAAADDDDNVFVIDTAQEPISSAELSRQAAPKTQRSPAQQKPDDFEPRTNVSSDTSSKKRKQSENESVDLDEHGGATAIANPKKKLQKNAAQVSDKKAPKKIQVRKRRTKPVPKGTQLQCDWYSLKNQEEERPTGDKVAPPRVQNLRLIRSAPESLAPRSETPAPETYNLAENVLPLNMPRRGDSDAEEETLLAQLDPIELATDSEPEDGERSGYLKKLSKEAPSWRLNRFQLRQSFAAAYNSKHGVRPSLSDSRLASFLQRLARNYYAAERIEQKWNETTFRVHYENVRGGDSFESFYTQIGSVQGQRKQYEKLGAFYTSWSIDGFSHWYIKDLKIWVSLNI
jgi:hypothetical protein